MQAVEQQEVIKQMKSVIRYQQLKPWHNPGTICVSSADRLTCSGLPFTESA